MSAGTALVPPTRSNSRSCSTRRRSTCVPTGSSPTSSRKSVPPAATSKRPRRRCSAPVNAPRSWPKSSDAIKVSGIAAQLTLTKGPAARRDQAWMARARSSLPVPVSPLTSTVDSVAATFRVRASSPCTASEAPTTSLTIAVSSCDVPRMEHVVDGPAQACRAGRLAQELGRAGVSGAALLFVARPAGDEHDRNVRAALGQAALDFQTVHPRHANVEQQTPGLARRAGVEELLAGGEHPGAIAEGADQPVRRLPYRCVVVDYRNERGELSRPIAALTGPRRARARHARTL